MEAALGKLLDFAEGGIPEALGPPRDDRGRLPRRSIVCVVTGGLFSRPGPRALSSKASLTLASAARPFRRARRLSARRARTPWPALTRSFGTARSGDTLYGVREEARIVSGRFAVFCLHCLERDPQRERAIVPSARDARRTFRRWRRLWRWSSASVCGRASSPGSCAMASAC